jgi:hypothetical protein
MSNSWYEIVDPGKPITQGDIIFDCPLITWQANRLDKHESIESEILKNAIEGIAADVVVMTQACDLEYNKVSNVILCPHFSLEEYRNLWEVEMERRNQVATKKAWKSHCDDICEGFIWNLMMLNSAEISELSIDARVVDFHEVFSVPRQFLESLLQQRTNQRFRLLPPYREHLSQAFARFFMRVGLPVPIEKTW